MKITYEEMQARRDRIVLSAFHSFCERGIENVTLFEIAKAAGVGESTIYRYFENKTSLVIEILTRRWNIVVALEAPVVERISKDPILTGYEKIAVWLDLLMQIHQKNPELISFSNEAGLYLQRHETKYDWDRQKMMKKLIRGPCLAALEKGKEDGSIEVQEKNEKFFYAIWSAVWGCAALYGGKPYFEKCFQAVKTGILRALHSGRA